MPVTRKDVAKLAGVSTATVSYVLNNTCKVKEETRERVLCAIKELDYKPNMIAKSMSTNKSLQLGIVLDNLANPFFGDIVKGFEIAASEKMYFVNICTGFHNLDNYFDNFIARRLDGIFVAAIPSKFNIDKLYKLVDQGIKVVTSGNIGADFRKVSAIENDHINAMKTAMEYLYGLGHRDIAYISGLGADNNYDLRCKGYLDMVQELNLNCKDNLLFEGKYPYTTDVPDGYKGVKELLSSGKKITAVICTNDLMALGAMKALKENGLRVPEDVSVMGFDGISYGEYASPSLTTMSFDKIAFGRKAFELLYINMIQDTTSYYENKLELIERASTGKCNC